MYKNYVVWEYVDVEAKLQSNSCQYDGIIKWVMNQLNDNHTNVHDMMNKISNMHVLVEGQTNKIIVH